MFTGIIEFLGSVVASTDDHLVVDAGHLAADSAIGASIAVNGVCLTVVSRDGDALGFDVSAETRARSGLGSLRAGDRVNLERPLSLAGRLGGHLVQGHVDGVGEITAAAADPAGGARLTIAVPEALARYVVEKGSITVDGVSLTVASIDGDGITIALIPHTLAVTTLGSTEPGDRVNLEVDVIARYVERAIGGSVG
jgi:riboflavin synthase